MFRTLLSQIKQYKRDTILTPICAALEVVMEVLIPYTTASIIDKGISRGDVGQICLYGGAMLLLAFMSMLFGVLAGRYAARACSGFACNLRDTMYAKIQTFSFANIDKFSTAGLITRMTTDVTTVQNAEQMLLRIAVRAPFTLICSMVMAFITNARISLVFLIATIVLSLALTLIIRKVSGMFRQVFAKFDELNASVQENVSAIRVVKAFVREDHENSKFTRAALNLRNMFVKTEGFMVLNSPIMMLVIYACIISISWLGAQFIVVGDMTTGELTSMFSYVMSILGSLMMLSMIFVMMTMSIASGKRIAEVLDEVPDLSDPQQPVTDVASGEIEFDNVSFTYHKEGTGEAILRDINLHINAGETIGIIGGTGCGKSSLVNLISRLYDVTAGSVKVGGRDVRDYDMEALRNQVAVVLQKNVLFSGSILDNLRWGKEDATLEECQEVCRQACADEFIDRMPEGYDTHIEQGGANVSGGQKQRLCIARALLKRPKVLILDDSTSAVDTATDAKIRQAFAQRIPGTTKIIIAQRIASVQDADRIIVMEDGRIDGFDTHENLLAANEIYREIYETQTQGGGDFDEPGKDGEQA